MPLITKVLDPILDIVGETQLLRFNKGGMPLANLARLLIANQYAPIIGRKNELSLEFQNSQGQGFKFEQTTAAGGTSTGDFVFGTTDALGVLTPIWQYDSATETMVFVSTVAGVTTSLPLTGFATVDYVDSHTWLAAKITDLATTVKSYTLSEFATLTASLDCGNQNLTNVADGVNSNDAVNLTQLQALGLSNMSTTGLMVRTGANTYETKQIKIAPDSANNLFIGSGDGISTDPTLAFSKIPSFDQITVNQDPVNAQDVVRKVNLDTLRDYVDSAVAGMDFKNPCAAATTASLNATYNNGASGVGATLTNADVQNTFFLDGVGVGVGERVAVKDETLTFRNGIYIVTNAGSNVTNWVLTRASDYDTVSEINPGNLIPVQYGSVNAGTLWLQVYDVNNVGTDAIVFTQFSYGATSFLQPNNNLSDVTDTSIARVNLGNVTTKTYVDTADSVQTAAIATNTTAISDINSNLTNVESTLDAKITTGLADAQSFTNSTVNAVYADIALGDYKDTCLLISVASHYGIYNNGTGGVNASLTNAGTLEQLAIDGQIPAVNKRIILNAQANAAENGIYIVEVIGTQYVPWVLRRVDNYNTANNIKVGNIIAVKDGVTNASTLWMQTQPIVNVGTDGLSFTRVGGAATAVVSLDGAITASGYLGTTITTTLNPVQSIVAINQTVNWTGFFAQRALINNLTSGGGAGSNPSFALQTTTDNNRGWSVVFNAGTANANDSSLAATFFNSNTSTVVTPFKAWYNSSVLEVALASRIAMGANKIIGLAAGTATTDAVNKGQMDTAIAAGGGGGGSTTAYNVLTTSALVDWNWALGDITTVTLDQDIILKPIPTPTKRRTTLIVKQGGAGNKKLALSVGVFRQSGVGADVTIASAPYDTSVLTFFADSLDKVFLSSVANTFAAVAGVTYKYAFTFSQTETTVNIPVSANFICRIKILGAAGGQGVYGAGGSSGAGGFTMYHFDTTAYIGKQLKLIVGGGGEGGVNGVRAGIGGFPNGGRGISGDAFPGGGGGRGDVRIGDVGQSFLSSTILAIAGGGSGGTGYSGSGGAGGGESGQADSTGSSTGGTQTAGGTSAAIYEGFAFNQAAFLRGAGAVGDERLRSYDTGGGGDGKYGGGCSGGDGKTSSGGSGFINTAFAAYLASYDGRTSATYQGNYTAIPTIASLDADFSGGFGVGLNGGSGSYGSNGKIIIEFI